MPINQSKLTELMKAAKADLKKNGFVGMDYNMAVICIIAKRTDETPPFAKGDGSKSYNDKIEYWASKRHFAHLQVASEDALLEHALKEYKV